jgi:hypothetical protein
LKEKQVSGSACGFWLPKDGCYTAKYASWFGVSVIKKQNLLSKLECCHKLEQFLLVNYAAEAAPCSAPESVTSQQKAPQSNISR